MKKFLLLLLIAVLPIFAQTKLDLATGTKGVLPSAMGGRGDTSNGVNGQVLIGDGSGHFAPSDPIVSFNYANLLSAQPATAQAAGSPVRLSTFGAAGTLYITFASITGSGTSCTVQLKNFDSLGNGINSGSPISITPANGTTSAAVSPALALQTAAQLSATYSCSAYPSGGTITVDFVPAVSVGIAGTVNIAGTIAVSNFPPTQPISAVSLPLPTGAAQEHTGASSFNATRLTDGTAFYKPTTPSDTQPISAASLPLPSGASQEHTAANSPAAVRLTDGTTFYKGTTPADTQPISAASLPLPTGAATSANQPALVGGRVPVDPSGVTSPVNGTVTGNQGTPASTANRWPVQVTDGTNLQSVNASGGGEVTGDIASAVTDAGNPVKTGGVFNTTQPTVTNGQRVDNQSTSRGAQIVATGVDTFNVTINAALPAGSNTIGNVKLTDGTNTQAVKAASTAAAATDPSSVTQLSPNQPQLTTPLNVQGGKTNNNAAPGATNVGTLPGVANAAPPTFTEGNQGGLSFDLKGNLRVYGHPPDVLGCYMVNGRTSTYSGLSAGTPLFSFRWGDATRLAVIMRIRINVATTTAATAAGQAEREMIIARSFTASDTGGTAVTLTGNNQKMRTSQGTSLVTDMRFGTTITAGTRTLDANPIGSAVSWLPLGMTGLDIGGGGCAGPIQGGATPTAWNCVGGIGYVPLLEAITGQDYPLVLAQNEGFIIRIGKDAMPSTAVQQTYVSLSWCEVNAY